MVTEPLELEDGEVVDDEPEDAFETYKILQRPHLTVPTPALAPTTTTPTTTTTITTPTSEELAKMGYSDDSDNSKDTESDSDSDSAPVRSKKPKIKIKKCRSIEHGSKTKNDKYKVWCNQVQEESLTEDLVSCGVTKSFYHERSVESYNYKLRYSRDTNIFANNNSTDDERDTEPRLTNKRTNADRRNNKLKLFKRRSSMEIDAPRGSMKIISELSVGPDSTDAEVASDITMKLNEKKNDLIKRVIDIIGKEKAIDFFNKTKEIEENGGMLIMNGSRRRTAGGIYFWLVKNDEHIPQEKIKEIFFQDKTQAEQRHKAMNKSKITQKAQELMRSLENGTEKDLPALLTRAELNTRQIAEEARLRRGAGMDKIPLDSDRTVTNPPPSPVTDDPDHLEHPPISRQVQDYSDDFLDIGVDVDSMEVF